MEKRQNSGFFKAVVAYDIKVDLFSQLDDLL